MIKAVIGVTIILALALWGSGDASRDEIVVRAALIAVAVFLFPLVYLVNFTTIPPKLAAEARAKEATMQIADEKKCPLNNEQLEEIAQGGPLSSAFGRTTPTGLEADLANELLAWRQLATADA